MRYLIGIAIGGILVVVLLTMSVMRIGLEPEPTVVTFTKPHISFGATENDYLLVNFKPDGGKELFQIILTKHDARTLAVGMYGFDPKRKDAPTIILPDSAIRYSSYD